MTDAAGPRPVLPPLRVLMIATLELASSQIVAGLFRGLHEQGALSFTAIDESRALNRLTRAAIADCDILVCFRSYTPDLLAVMRHAQRAGRLAIYAIDDDFRALDPATELGRIHHHPTNRAAQEALIREADLLWVYTEEMRQRYQTLNPRVVIGRLPSWVEHNRPARLDEDPHAPWVIGHGGSRAHPGWEVVVAPLQRLLGRHATARVEFFHFVPPALADHPRVRLLPYIPDLAAYHRYLRTAGWTVGLAPLADTPLTRGKTNNKYREFAGLGIPGIYSDVPLYAEGVRHLETGYLAPHSDTGFAEGLEYLLTQPAARARIRRGALADAASRYSLAAAQMQLLDELSRLAIARRLQNWHRPRVLVVGHDIPPVEIGVLQPCDQLQRDGVVDVTHELPATLEPPAVDDVDAVVVMRAMEPELLWLLDKTARRGIPTVSAWDDDFLSIDAESPLGEHYRHPAMRQAITRFLHESALVVAATPALAERSRELTPHVMEAMFGLDTDRLDAPAPAVEPVDVGDEIRIGFFGSGRLDQPWVIEALRRVQTRHGARVRIEVIGLHLPECVRDLTSWSHTERLPYRQSLHLLRSRRWHVGLAPLADTPFDASKGATKFRDYAWAGIAMVCSRVPAYERTVIDGVHCRMVDNSAAAWAGAITDLIEHPADAHALCAAAAQLLAEVHGQRITNAFWRQLIWRMGVHRAATPATARTPPIVDFVGTEASARRPLRRVRRYLMEPRRLRWMAIELLLRNPSTQAAEADLLFTLGVRDGTVLRAAPMKIAIEANADRWVTWTFDPIDHAAGHQFLFTVRSVPGSAPVSIAESPNRPRLFAAVRRRSPNGMPYARVTYQPAEAGL